MDRIPEERVYTDLKFASQVPEHVYHIDLRNRRLSTIPEELYKFPNLRSINLSGNTIEKVEIRPSSFQNVELLDLSNNRINEFAIGNNSLTFLKTLNLDNNKLVYFPQLGNFKFVVEELSIRYNFIAHIPLGELFPSTVKVLSLDNNPIKNHEVIFSEGTQIEELYLYQTGLKKLPEKLRLERLFKLNIGNNPLEFQSFESSNYPKLVHLDISNMDLSNTLPLTELRELKKLHYLNIESCKLHELSEIIGEMKSLKEINLMDNNLSELPNAFYDLKLKQINLKRNPLNSATKTQLKKSFKKSKLELD